MSAAIINSLHRLNNAVHTLETALQGKAAEIKTVRKAATEAKRQPIVEDLFTVMSRNAQSSQQSNLNVKMLASRLDNAINQVEMILNEGRG